MSNSLLHRQFKNRLMQSVSGLAIAIGLLSIIVLFAGILADGINWLNWDFITSFPSRVPEQAGIKSALWGSVWVTILAVAICFPLGIGAAIWLEEYATDSVLMRIIKVNIANLAGVPSIVYGLLGLALFVNWLSLGRSVLAGALTIALLVLPMIILTTQEALRGVPLSHRLGGYALGSTRWQVVWNIVLPEALPNISTGLILATARAIGEAAPMIAIAALVYLTSVPTGVMDRFTVLPIQIFNWLSRPQADFHGLAAAGIIVLLTLLIALNGTAIILRAKYQHQSEE